MALISDKIGVCIQPDTTGPIVQTAKVNEAMSRLKLRMFRIRAPIVGADSWRRIYMPLGLLGFRFLFTHAFGRDVKAEVADLVTFDQQFPGQLIAYEGPNEPDLNPVTYGGITDPRLGVRTGNGQAAIALVKAQRNTLRAAGFSATLVHMVAFNDWMQEEQSEWVGFGNSHIYPGTASLASKLSSFDARMGKIKNGTGYITEFGRHNVVASKQVAQGVSEADAATLMSQDIPAIMADRKLIRLFLFNLVDFNSASSDVEARFGLFRSDWSAKPVAGVIAQMAAQ